MLGGATHSGQRSSEPQGRENVGRGPWAGGPKSQFCSDPPEISGIQVGLPDPTPNSAGTALLSVSGFLVNS